MIPDLARFGHGRQLTDGQWLILSVVQRATPGGREVSSRGGTFSSTLVA